MPTPDGANWTSTLLAISMDEDPAGVQDRLFLEFYGELRRMAASLLRQERPDHTLQPTALVNEAYIRLVDRERVPWEARAHFFGAAARAMRRILIDHARKALAEKRGVRPFRVTLDEELVASADPNIELVDLDRLICRLSTMDDRVARVVELRVFGGMSIPEVALVLGISPRSVDGDWAFAKRWLRQELV